MLNVSGYPGNKEQKAESRRGLHAPRAERWWVGCAGAFLPGMIYGSMPSILLWDGSQTSAESSGLMLQIDPPLHRMQLLSG